MQHIAKLFGKEIDRLDTEQRNQLIIKLKNELSVTSVVVTHDIASAFKVADRILMLHEGRFIADGTAGDFRNATDARVRQFVTGESTLSTAATVSEESSDDRS